MAFDGALATAQQEAYHFLRDQILSGELTGNSRLNPAEIADQLGISRMPVREALRQLDAEGLVTMRPNRAAFVSQLSAAEVEELFEIRTALEVMAVGHAVRHLTDDSLAELIALKERMDRARNDNFEWVKRHEDFHQAICNISPRKRLAREVARMRIAIRPHLLAYMKIFDRVEMPGLEHSSLIDALASRNVKRAEEEMRQHVANPGMGLIEFLRKRDSEMTTSPGSRLSPLGSGGHR
jgi:DNA-binding GntR family transcriptional regulator